MYLGIQDGHLISFSSFTTFQQLKMFIVGLTGGIATGKSTVSKIFKELGCQVIDADQIAREGRRFKATGQAILQLSEDPTRMGDWFAMEPICSPKTKGL